MNIKSLLLGSAAALAAVSGAQAADAIIAAEPEPMEYVRVCDAFGTGYFYIPGTETCLKIGGYVRFQVDFSDNETANGYNGDDWDAWTRGRLEVVAKSDTELGELTGFMAIHGDMSEDTDNGSDFYFDEVYLQLGGFKAGTYLNWWDKGINGETDKISNTTRMTSIAYIFSGDAFSAGIQLDELSYATSQEIGLEGLVSASFGAASIDLLGAYDFGVEEGAIRALVSAGIGPGTFQVAGVWASGANEYYDRAEWSIAASYAFKATDRFTVTPGVQFDSDRRFISGNDAWRVGATLDYAIVENLALKTTVHYNDEDDREEFWDGFVRLERKF